MSDRLPEYRVSITASPKLRWLGCAGCLFAIFILGGVVGILLFGWKTLLGG